MLVTRIVVNVLLCLFAGRVAAWRGYGAKLGIFMAAIAPVLSVVFAWMFPPFGLITMGLIYFGWLLPCFLPPTEAAIEHYAEDGKTRRELEQDRHTLPCPHCRRLNSVRTGICGRCELHGIRELRQAA